MYLLTPTTVAGGKPRSHRARRVASLKQLKHICSNRLVVLHLSVSAVVLIVFICISAGYKMLGLCDDEDDDDDELYKKLLCYFVDVSTGSLNRSKFSVPAVHLNLTN